MPSGLLPILVVVAALAGAMSYLSAYHQMAHAYVPHEARRRALGATVGPVAFYGCLATLLWMALPRLLHA